MYGKLPSDQDSLLVNLVSMLSIRLKATHSPLQPQRDDGERGPRRQFSQGGARSQAREYKWERVNMLVPGFYLGASSQLGYVRLEPFITSHVSLVCKRRV